MDCDLILMAEDEPEQAELARRAFKKYCFINPIFIVSDGTEVLSYLLGEGNFANRDEYPLPSLLLLDLRMQRMHGFDVIRWVRAHPDFKELPIVVLSTSDELRDVNQAYSMGATSFMMKPVEFVEFVHITTILPNYWLWLNTAPKLPLKSWQRFD
jgi:CheY-like chemotaxis protein